MGPALDPNQNTEQAKGSQYEEDTLELNPENDPEWYKSNMAHYPC